MKTSEDLIKEVKSKLGELDEIDREFAENQNIIGLLGKGHDEVSFCKILWYILNLSVNGKKEYLAEFVKTVLRINGIDSEIESASVYREYYIPETGRRIDLVIRTKNHFLPIEAKIYSDEHGGQCADYLKFAEGVYGSNPGNALVWFLTLDGQKPAESDTQAYREINDRIKCISWKDVKEWLTNVKYTHHEYSELIGQLCKALFVLLNPRKDYFDMIDNLISSSEDIKAALIISESIERKRIELLFDIFNGIREALAGDPDFLFDPILNNNWKNDDRIRDYYSQKKSSYPGLNYNLGLIDTDVNGMHYYFVLRFEIDYRGFAGYGIWTVDKEGNLGQLCNPDEIMLRSIRSRLDNPHQIRIAKDWWLYWEYVASNNWIEEEESAGPNFKNMNNTDYISLFDAQKKDKFIQKAVDCLKKIRKAIN